MTTSAADLLAYAKQYLGRPYQFGAAGPDRFDCSGFTQYVFHHFGVALPHHAADQAKLGTAVDKGAIQAGDLVFSNWGDGPNSHVGIAVGDGTIIDAPHTGAVVRYDKLGPSYLDHVTAVRRMDGVAGGGGTTGGDTPAKWDPGWPTFNPGVGGVSLQDFVGPAQAVGKAAISADAIGNNLMKLWAPTTWVRGLCGLLGVIFILLGVWTLTKELRN